jgi:hypothetical protein
MMTTRRRNLKMASNLLKQSARKENNHQELRIMRTKRMRKCPPTLITSSPQR